MGYYWSTVLDDYSRYIVHWELCEGMKVQDVKRTLDRAIIKAKIVTKQRPRLLSDNGSCYIAGEIITNLKEQYYMDQVHGRPLHPQTQGKIERYHRTIINIRWCKVLQRSKKEKEVKFDLLPILAPSAGLTQRPSDYFLIRNI